METVKILIPNSEAVSDFVNKTSSLPFDVDLGSGNRLVDAKSLLGVCLQYNLYSPCGRRALSFRHQLPDNTRLGQCVDGAVERQRGAELAAIKVCLI